MDAILKLIDGNKVYVVCILFAVVFIADQRGILAQFLTPENIKSLEVLIGVGGVAALRSTLQKLIDALGGESSK